MAVLRHSRWHFSTKRWNCLSATPVASQQRHQLPQPRRQHVGWSCLAAGCRLPLEEHGACKAKRWTWTFDRQCQVLNQCLMTGEGGDKRRPLLPSLAGEYSGRFSLSGRIQECCNVRCWIRLTNRAGLQNKAQVVVVATDVFRGEIPPDVGSGWLRQLSSVVAAARRFLVFVATLSSPRASSGMGRAGCTGWRRCSPSFHQLAGPAAGILRLRICRSPLQLIRPQLWCLLQTFRRPRLILVGSCAHVGPPPGLPALFCSLPHPSPQPGSASRQLLILDIPTARTSCA